jgi:ribosome biogenesis GTPase / thiamine phosphate phosphatase
MRMSDLRRALVVSVGKNSAWVAPDGETSPRLATLRRMRGKRSMPVPGDIAWVEALGDGTVVVERLEPRGRVLERRTAAGRTKTLAANVDTLVTVTSLAHPPPRLVTLDQLLAFAELSETGTAIVFTKPDLANELERMHLATLYERLGYTVVVVNPKMADGVERLRDVLSGKQALLCGISGVGKSSIFRALGGESSVGDLSSSGFGRQTTTAARLYRLPDGFLIDSPGVSEFGLGKIAPRELAQGFIEMIEPSRHCRFTDCTHLREPDCAVRAAVSAGTIAESRYASYRRILLDPV